MRLNKYGRELDLILLLTGGGSYTTQQLADKLGITRRSVYYYIEYLRDSGFILHKSGARYRLDRQSPFFRQLHENIVLSEGEALFVHRMLDGVGQKNLTAQSIRAKLERYYGLGDISSPAVKRRMGNNVEILKQAIVQKKMVTLHGYSSPHSHSVSDRIVEPFLIFNEGLDARCYEVKTRMNKTFKTSRMKSVEIIDVPWIHEDLHREIFTDIFGFSGEERIRVQLRLGQLAYNIMLEEHPDAEPFITSEDDTHWLMDINVVSLLGIGRFVMGLYADVEVIGGEELKAYIEEQKKIVAG